MRPARYRVRVDALWSALDGKIGQICAIEHEHDRQPKVHVKVGDVCEMFYGHELKLVAAAR